VVAAPVKQAERAPLVTEEKLAKGYGKSAELLATKEHIAA
jgi:hypothetical protein